MCGQNPCAHGSHKSCLGPSCQTRANANAEKAVATKYKVLKGVQGKAVAVIKRAVWAAARARVLKRQAAAAKIKAIQTKSTASRAIVVRKGPARGTKRKAVSASATAATKKAKTANSIASEASTTHAAAVGST